MASANNPKWTEEELILTLDHYLAVDGRYGSPYNADVIALSEKLRRLKIHKGAVRDPSFRNSVGVWAKLGNFASLDPDRDGYVRPNGAKGLTEEIWNRYSGKAKAVHTRARRILAAARPKAKKTTTVPSWILVHSSERYADDDWYDDPESELAEEFDPPHHWHWKLPRAMKDDERPRTILLGWEQSIFGEATATITRNIRGVSRKRFNFAFVLHDYHPFKPIPFSALRLGKRERRHRSLIKMDTDNWAAYRKIRGEKSVVTVPPSSVPELAQIESSVENATNPHKSGGQGFGLTSKEKKCVELHAMDEAERYLTKHDYSWSNVSGDESFDFLATKSGQTLFVEVKGCTGDGEKIQLTKNEVNLHRLRHPNNMLVVVHSIKLDRSGKEPKASGGIPVVRSPWFLDEAKLTALSFAYAL